MNTEQPKVELPEFKDHLGEAFDPTWDYSWVLPGSVQWLLKKGFTQVGEPVEFYYGATMLCVGRQRVETTEPRN